jgi:DNA-binding PadR family transcriptional regulator
MGLGICLYGRADDRRKATQRLEADPCPTIAIDNIAMLAIPRTTMTDAPEIQNLLPLPAATFHILLAVAEEERHGYAIIQDVEARTDGELRMSAGTLYRSIARMVEQGLISEVTRRRTAEDDERRRYYRITSFGTAVARAEMRRMAQLLRLARASGLSPESA